MEALDSESKATTDFFIFSSNLEITNNEDLFFYNFYNILKQETFLLSKNNSNNKIYSVLKVNHFGSLFYGDYCYESPNILILTEIDPILLLIDIFYLSLKNSNVFQDYDDNFSYYKNQLSLIKHANKIDEDVINSSSEILDYLREYILNDETKLTLICEEIFVSYKSKNFYRLMVSKILDFLNQKLKDNCSTNIKNSASILTRFINEEIETQFIQFKNIKFVEERNNKNNFVLDVNNISSHTDTQKSNLKRKEDESNNKIKKNENTKKKTPSKQTKAVDKNQSKLNFNKK